MNRKRYLITKEPLTIQEVSTTTEDGVYLSVLGNFVFDSEKHHIYTNRVDALRNYYNLVSEKVTSISMEQERIHKEKGRLLFVLASIQREIKS